MPPRKSLPAPRAEVHRSLPRRGQSSTPQKPVQNGTTSRKRQRLAEVDAEDDLQSIEAEATAPVTRQADGVKPETLAATGGMDPEKELEHWQDFAVEHYEMVEQLPLELHRNYRLLRELDDGVAIHAEKLQNTIREYIAHRLGDPVKPAEIEATSPSRIPPLPSLTLDGGAGPVDMNGNELTSVMEIGVPESDGQGGEVMPAPEPEAVVDIEMSAEGQTVGAEQSIAEEEGRSPFPARSPIQPEADVSPGTTGHSTQDVANKMETKKDNCGWKLLPEIARLAREMVKNGEEKVAVAQGAYNSIDRHIRALDSALSAQEASILLGLRPSTLPSTAVENGLDNGETGALADIEEGAMGTGGGGARRKGRGARGRGRGRGGARGGGRNGEAPITAAVEAIIVPPEFADADPNEPRYCYCNQISYGEMMACDNDDCPIEWFHIACAGFTAAPTGNWLCNICNTSPTKGGKGTGTPAGRGTNKRTRGRGRGRQTR